MERLDHYENVLEVAITSFIFRLRPVIYLENNKLISPYIMLIISMMNVLDDYMFDLLVDVFHHLRRLIIMKI